MCRIVCWIQRYRLLFEKLISIRIRTSRYIGTRGLIPPINEFTIILLVKTFVWCAKYVIFCSYYMQLPDLHFTSNLISTLLLKRFFRMNHLFKEYWKYWNRYTCKNLISMWWPTWYQSECRKSFKWWWFPNSLNKIMIFELKIWLKINSLFLFFCPYFYRIRDRYIVIFVEPIDFRELWKK